MQRRLIQLDVLRAVCVFLVLGRHLTPCSEDISPALNKITTFWNYGGWVGVDIFFVLSGFLVSGLLFREYRQKGDVRLKRFLIRRGLKIYPSFYVLIAATILINPIFGEAVPIVPLLAEVFFVQNLIFGRLWTHTWSLAVEEHFYIGLAMMVYFLLRRRQKAENPFARIPLIFIFLAATCFALRLLMAIYKGTNISPTPFRIDALFFGVLISYLWHYRELGENPLINKYKNWLISAGGLILLPMFFFMSVNNPQAFVFGLTTNYIGAGLLLIGFLKIKRAPNLTVKTVSYVGAYSYSIYLWHLPVQEWLAIPLSSMAGGNNWFFYAGFYLAGSIVLGILMSKIIEYPILRIRDKYFPPMNPAFADAAQQNSSNEGKEKIASVSSFKHG